MRACKHFVPALVLASLAALSLGLVRSAGAAADVQTGVRFLSAPARVLQGHDARVIVAVRPTTARCSLVVRYKGGTTQAGLRAVRALRGRASWTWRVPKEANAGAADAFVNCGRAGRATRTITIVGEIIPARIDVIKQGWSVRQTSATSSQVSYGLLLKNVSPHQDALQILANVNFVGPGDRLIGTQQTTISVIGAGAEYALGNYITFPGAAPVERLEVSLKVDQRAPRAIRFPALTNLYVEPSTQPSWVGAVGGEIQNDTNFILRSAKMSGIILDAAGNIIGGGYGSAIGNLLPGARQFFKFTSGVNAVVFARAAGAVVSIEPQYA